MMASDRANPSCEQKQVGKSILKKKKNMLVHEYLIRNHLSTRAWIKTVTIATSVQ